MFSIPEMTYNIETYQWMKSGFHYPIASMTSYTINSGSPTYYGTCTVGNVGMQELSEVTFVAYPNPATALVTVSSSSDIASVEVTDLSGKIVAKSNGNSVDISNIDSGVYLLSIITLDGNSSVSQRIIKK